MTGLETATDVARQRLTLLICGYYCLFSGLTEPYQFANAHHGGYAAYHRNTYHRTTSITAGVAAAEAASNSTRGSYTNC